MRTDDPSSPAPGRRAWTPEEVRRLGMTTDLATAAEVIGIGRTLAYGLVRTGDFPVRLLRLGRRCGPAAGPPTTAGRGAGSSTSVSPPSRPDAEAGTGGGSGWTRPATRSRSSPPPNATTRTTPSPPATTPTSPPPCRPCHRPGHRMGGRRGQPDAQGLPDRRDHHRPARPPGAADRAPPAPPGRGTARDRRPGPLVAALDHHQHRRGMTAAAVEATTGCAAGSPRTPSVP